MQFRKTFLFKDFIPDNAVAGSNIASFNRSPGVLTVIFGKFGPRHYYDLKLLKFFSYLKLVYLNRFKYRNSEYNTWDKLYTALPSKKHVIGLSAKKIIF